MSEELPSVNDFIEDRSNFSSVKSITEENLPSYKDFIEPKEEIIHEEVEPQVEQRQDNTEIIVSLIESVRNSIPEVKSYDKELYELVQLIEEVRKEIPVVPEPPEFPEIPEVRYYEEQIDNLQEQITEVKGRDIPDFTWIGKYFSSINDDYESVSSSLAQLKGKLDLEINNLVETIEVNKFERNVDTKNFNEKVSDISVSLDSRIQDNDKIIREDIENIKNKIYDNLRETSLQIWNLNKEFKSEDKKLETHINDQYELLTSTIGEVLKESDRKHEDINKYFDGLKEEIRSLPEVKYYDDEIDKVNQSVKSVQNLVEVLENKLNNKIAGLRESILVVPPTENNTDPLTPLDKNFATLDDLSNHYRLFLNRIQTQLATLGGGGENNNDGWEYVSDKALESTPIALAADTWTAITNDGTSGSTNREWLPKDSGITRVYDVVNNKIKLNELPTDGHVIFRLGVKFVPNVDNTTVKTRIAWTTESDFTFYLESTGTLLNDGAGIEYEKQFILPFYVGDLDSKNGYGIIQVRADGACSITDSAFFTIIG